MSQKEKFENLVTNSYLYNCNLENVNIINSTEADGIDYHSNCGKYS